MGRNLLLVITAVGEAGTGLALMFAPSLVISLLLGVTSAAPEALVIGRVTGGALLAIGVACWTARNDGSPTQRGVLSAVLIYDVTAAAVLTYAGGVSATVGVVLWPAVGVHVVLAGWALLSVVGAPIGWSNDRI